MANPVTTTPIPHLDAMKRVDFTRYYVDPGEPVVLSGAVDSWPALDKWSHSWFRDRFGARTVQVSFGGPLEGRRESMTLGHYLDIIARSAASVQPYLRLEPLPGVFPELSEDFALPRYCPAGRNVAVHLWIGPERTVQPFHKDNQNPLSPVHNLLVQVRGRKLVSLVSADQDEKMYRYPPGSARANYSQVDYIHPDHERFPRFRTTVVAETVVGPGEMIFIPADTWHHVRALDPSISLSFWWYRTIIADVVASLSSSVVRRPGGHPSEPAIDVRDVDEFGGIWALALATRTLPPARRPLMIDTCAEPVAVALRAALAHLDRRD